MDSNDNLTKLVSLFEDKPEEEKLDGAASIKIARNTTNVVSGKTLRKVQDETLKAAKDFLSCTFGPMGSNTKIITGDNIDNISSSYSKDGLKVLKNIKNSGPIEASIVEELDTISRHVEHEVGDGTTSTVILSSLIFSKLMKIQEEFNVPPFQLMREFNSAVEKIKTLISENGKECTLDDIYNISMISTNGNEEVSENIRKVYEEQGMTVDLNVGISNDENSKLKKYDGLTITEGMADPAFINNLEENTSVIHNPRIYHFVDPIDTEDQIMYLKSILNHNYYDRIANDEEIIPTVITCPRISKDTTAVLKKLYQELLQFNNPQFISSKPQILIITNVLASDEVIMDDIANLCGCKTISKYLDPNVLKRDQEAGIAPTIETVADFYGEAEMVVADGKKTKFINPAHMHYCDETGEIKEDPQYIALINFLEAEIANVKSTATAGEIGTLRKRLSALKANAVDYLVGGVTIAERDAIKDLVEDAIKNCKSASLYGVGYAANFEGLLASKKYFDTMTEYNLKSAIAGAIFVSYRDISEILYSTVSNDKDEVVYRVVGSLKHGYPYDISSGSLPDIDDISGDKVKCSIMLDQNILDTISKIVTMMVTCNQCLLQAPSLNNY